MSDEMPDDPGADAADAMSAPAPDQPAPGVDTAGAESMADDESSALIAFLSATTTLEPGDVLLTGTPPGVGFARRPPVYVAAGDVMEVEIDGLGVLRNPVVAARS